MNSSFSFSRIFSAQPASGGDVPTGRILTLSLDRTRSPLNIVRCRIVDFECDYVYAFLGCILLLTGGAARLSCDCGAGQVRWCRSEWRDESEAEREAGEASEARAACDSSHAAIDAVQSVESSG